MTYKTQIILEDIKDIISDLEKEMHYDNAKQDFEVNKWAEDYYLGLLNLIFQDWNLVNLNTIIHNHPAIDLGSSVDSGAQIGVQITTETSKAKIEETLKTYHQNPKSCERFTEIYILMIKGKKIPSGTLKNESSVHFDRHRHIWDNTDLLSFIRSQHCTIEQLNSIQSYIKKHIRIRPNLYQKKFSLPIVEKSKNINIFNSQSVRILQISDFDITSEDIIGIPNTYNHFIETLALITEKIDLVIYNGNLIKSDTTLFHKAFEKYLHPILEKLNLTCNDIFFCPGINDLDTTQMQFWRESGIQNDSSDLIRQSKLKNDALPKLGNYFEFIKFIYKGFSEKSISIFDSNFIFNHKVGKFEIGISALNNVWTYSPHFQGDTQMFGSEQLSNACAYIDDTALKIGITYFPLNKLSNSDRESAHKFLSSYDLLFFSNAEQTKFKTGFYEKTFYSFISKDTDRFIGQLIEFNPERQEITTTKIQNGVEISPTVFNLPTSNDIRIIQKNEEIIKRLEQTEFEKINKHLIYYGASTCAPSNISDIFVMPKISNTLYDNSDETKDASVTTKIYDLQEIISSEESYVIFGRKETGKSLLLNRIFVDVIHNYDSYKLFPVFIHFESIKNLEILTEIKRYLGINTSEAKDKLTKNEIIILIDDLTFAEHDSHNIKSINNFKKEYPRIKIVGVSKQTSELDIPWEDHKRLDGFQALFIRTFGTKQIKHLAEKWFKGNTSFDTKEAIDRVLKNFFSLSLPTTPMSASLFFWIIETQEKRQINNSSLIEAFIDKLLESKNQIYRDSFDSKNKKYLLANIAHLMFERNLDNYTIEYGKLVDYIHQYLVNKRFNSNSTKPFDASRLLDNLIERGIFTKNDNSIKFRFPCFFHFFLALQMQYDTKFKEFVLEEENYLDFIDEIDYYTGLVRNDENTLEILYNRLKKEFDSIKPHFKASDIDNFFKENLSVAKKADLQKVIENAPSEKAIEKINDKALEHGNSNKDIKKKGIVKSNRQLDELIMLVANVLRNTEETSIEKGFLKEIVYQEIVSDMVLHMCFYKIALIKYYNKYKSVPNFLPWKININFLLKILPLIYQVVFYDWMGSLKLSAVLLDKIESDKNNKKVSRLEGFISVFCLVDLKVNESKIVLRKYIDNIPDDNNTLIDLCFFKVLNYFYIRSKKNTIEEETYIDLLIDLKLKGLNQYKDKLKGDMKKEFKKLKEKNLLT